MEIGLRAQADGSISIEHYKVTYPFSLYCGQNNTTEIIWDDKEWTAFEYANLSSTHPIHLYFQRKIDITDFDDTSKKLDYSKLAVDLYKPPATKIITNPQFNLDKSLYNKLQGVYSVSNYNAANMIINKVNKGWTHTDVTLKPGLKNGKQYILFEKKYFGFVCNNDKYKKHTVKPRLKKLPFFFFENNLKEFQNTVEFFFEFDDKTKKVSNEYMKLYMHLRLKDEK